ncbi:MAG: family 20 glycosylhydrolase [Bacteroides sp.]
MNVKQLSLLLMLSACSVLCVAQQKVSILPTPVEVIPQQGTFALKNGTSIGVSHSSLLPAGRYLQRMFPKIKTTLAVGKGDISLQLDAAIKGKEGAYQLSVSTQKVIAKAAGYAGILTALSSLQQLLPLDGNGTLLLPAVTINDAPRFGWRGLMMDASRHFWSKTEVEKVLDLMALYKLNKFHWHLTDDQGWRIEIKQYPLLTEKGAWRKFNSHDKDCMHRAKVEDNADYLLPADKMKVVDGDTLYGGYYTQQDIKDIVTYATQRGIEVIPEIDMPGHFLAAISQYPEVACSGLIGWGATFSSPICPGKDATLDFCKNIYKEVFTLFPSTYIHLGGDEVEKANWKKCADCQQRMKQENLRSEEELQAWFVRNMESFFHQNGKQMIGWDEVVADGLSKDAIIMWWRSWNPKAVPLALGEGKQLIQCPNGVFYFDAQQDKESLKHVLAFDPMANIPAGKESLMMGIQANLWAEWIPSIQRLEYMALPRMLALSEVAWATPLNKIKEADFYTAAAVQFKRLDKLGVNYRLPDLEGFYNINAFVDETTLHAVCPLAGTEIRYTTDGSFPTKASTLYTGDVKVTESTEFMLRTFRPDGSPCDVVKTSFVKTPYAKADTQAQPSANGLKAVWYNFNGKFCAEIDKAPVKKEYVTETIALPAGEKGDLALILKGYLQVPADGIYTFALRSDDGSTLTLDGALALDNDKLHAPAEIIAQKALQKGLHPIEIRYFDKDGGVLELCLINNKGERQALPKDWLKH